MIVLHTMTKVQVFVVMETGDYYLGVMGSAVPMNGDAVYVFHKADYEPVEERESAP